ncbi:PqqD family protein [Thermosynechococcaceae cyanobacterium BACA0444]|uniref:PqqD family protein n=1 Tax=Pseudocalidococcus azoricus BACA0444 TaxID=2918990 RepID=A0AAE4JZS6_9CYAN|nr:PqqD family protein [Pseudocalidococcus azoricus]MDS3861162.1 PqqD family protein [Pseudocalidococcus azoricus BACA0444]
MKFRVNTPTVVSEVIEGEAVILNLDSGNYYSMEGSGAIIWELLSQGLTVTEVGNWLAKTFNAHSDQMINTVAGLVDELQMEGLIVPLGEDLPDSESLNLDNMAVGKSFVEPKLCKYSDLQDLLILDPIHDVTDSGWPKANIE